MKFLLVKPECPSCAAATRNNPDAEVIQLRDNTTLMACLQFQDWDGEYPVLLDEDYNILESGSGDSTTCSGGTCSL